MMVPCSRTRCAWLPRDDVLRESSTLDRLPGSSLNVLLNELLNDLLNVPVPLPSLMAFLSSVSLLDFWFTREWPGTMAQLESMDP